MAYYNANIYKDYWNTNLANTSAKKLYSNYIYNYKNNVISPTQPQYNTGYPVIETGYRNYRKKAQPESYLSNYNDPFEINSLADVVLTTFNKDMKRGNWGGLEDIPLLNIFTGLGDLAWNTTIKPLLYGGEDLVDVSQIDLKRFDGILDNGIVEAIAGMMANTRAGTVVLNNLINFGETMDILANPVKALLLGEDPADAMGWGKNGRKNYDFDTGNTLLDMGLEVVVDPFNWISMGADAFLKKPTMVLTQTLDDIGGESAEHFSKVTSAQVMKGLADGTYQTIEEGLEKTLKGQHKALLIESATKKGIDLPTTLKVLNEYTTNVLEAKSRFVTDNIVRNVARMKNMSNSVEKALVKGAFIASGAYAPFKLLTKGFGVLGELSLNRIFNKSKPALYDTELGKYADLTKIAHIIDTVENEVSLANIEPLLTNKFVTKDLLQLLIDPSVAKTMKDVAELFIKHKDSPAEFNKALIKLLDLNDSVDALTELKKFISLANEKLDGKYTATLDYLDQLSTEMSHINKRISSEQNINVLNKSKEVIERVSENMRTVSDVFEDTDSLLSKTKQVISDVMTTHTNVDKITLKEQILQSLKDNLLQHTQDIFNMNIINNNILAEYLFEMKPLLDNINYFLKDISDQLDNVLIGAKTIDDLLINFKPAKLSSNIIEEDILQRIDDIIATEKLLLQEPTTIHNLDDLLAKSDTQFKYIDELKELNVAETRVRYDDPNVGKKVSKQSVAEFNQELTDTFSDVSDEPLQKAIAEFTELDVETTSFDTYYEKWLNLDRELNNTLNNLYSDTPSKGSKLIEKLKELNPLNTFKDEFVVTPKHIIYGLQEEKLHATMSLLNDKRVAEFFQQIDMNYGTGSVINQLANLANEELLEGAESLKGLIQQCVMFKEAAASRANYTRFVNTLLASTIIPDKFKYLILSELENVRHYNLTDLNFDSFLNKILDGVDTFSVSKNMSEKLTLGTLAEADEGVIKEAVAKILGDKYKRHMGVYDTATTYEVIKRKFPELLKNGKTNIIVDIETTGGKWFNSNVYDIGLTIVYPDGTVEHKALYKKLNEGGLDSFEKGALNHIFDDGTEDSLKLSDLEKRNKILELYSEGFNSEDELMDAFVNELKALDSTGTNCNIIGFNSNKFDNPYLTGKMRLENKKYYKNIEKVDVYQLLLKEQGIDVMTPAQRNYVGSLLSHFIDMQNTSKVSNVCDLQTGKLAATLQDIAIQLKASAEQFLGLDSNTILTHTNFLETIADDMYTDLQKRVEIKDFLSTLRIDSDSIKNGTYLKGIQDYINKHYSMPSVRVFDTEPGFAELKTFLDEYMPNVRKVSKFMEYTNSEKALIIKAYREYLEVEKARLLHKFEKYLNPSSLMYGTLKDGIYLSGYKKLTDSDIIEKWSKYGFGSKLDFTLAESLTKVGRTLEYYRRGIKNAKLLEPLEQDILDALKRIANASSEKVPILETIVTDKATKSVEFLLNFTSDTGDLVSNWALLHYLYQQYNNKRLLTDTFKDSLNPDLLKLLENDITLKSFANQDVNLNIHMLEDFLEVIPGENLKNAQHLNRISQEFRSQIVDPFGALNAAFDENSAYRSRSQAIASSLSKIADTLDEYNNVILKYSTTVDELYTFVRSIKSYSDGLAIQHTYNTLLRDVDELFKTMVYSAPWIECDLKDLPLNYLQYLSDNSESFKKAGINIIVEDERLYLALDNSIKITTRYDTSTHSRIFMANGVEVERPHINELDFSNKQGYKHFDKLTEMFKESMDQFSYLSRGTSNGSLGEVVTIQWLEEMYSKLPARVRAILPPLEELTREELFDGFRYNFINLGSISGRAKKQPLLATTFMKTLKTNAEMVSSHALTKAQYTSLYFAKGFSINNGWLADKDEDLLTALKQHPEYVLVALVEDEKYGCRTVRLNVKNTKQLQLARKLDPIIMPAHTYSKAVEVINGDLMRDTALKYWNRIIYTYKVGYLLDPGTFLRNYIDSTLKTILSTGEVVDTFRQQRNAVTLVDKYNSTITDVLKLDEVQQYKNKLNLKDYSELSAKEVLNAQLDAAALYNIYDEIQDSIIKMDIKGRFTESNLKLYFEKCNPKIDYDTYKLIDGFIKDGPSAGMTSAWTKYYAEHKKNGSEEDLNSLWNTFVHYSGKLMSPNEHIEQIARLSEYLMLMKKGYSNTEAFHVITKTHFDYGLRSNSEKIAELIFPFYTFMMRNFEYWVDLISEKPQVARQLDNIMEPIWNFDGYDYEEYSRNQSLQYQILAGNIPLTSNNMTLKLSPSFMDAFTLAVNPVDGITSKLFKPYTELPEAIKGTASGEQSYSTIINQLPIIGTLNQRYGEQGPKYYERTGNILNAVLPGVFGATKRWQEFPKKNYPKKNYNYKKYNSSYSGRSSRKRYNKYNKYITTRSYFSNYYPGRDFAPKKYWTPLMKGMPRGYNVNTNTSKNYSNGSFYRKHYTKTGRSRLKARMIPVTGYTLKYRIKDYSRYSR